MQVVENETRRLLYAWHLQYTAYEVISRDCGQCSKCKEFARPSSSDSYTNKCPKCRMMGTF